VISLEEFREGCRLLNKNLHPDYQLTDIDHTLKLMDFDGSGTIDINEFFEVSCSGWCQWPSSTCMMQYLAALFRIAESLRACQAAVYFLQYCKGFVLFCVYQTFRILEGKVDGVISIAKREGSVFPAAVPRADVTVQAKQALV
jgi:hypothetical protein